MIIVYLDPWGLTLNLNPYRYLIEPFTEPLKEPFKEP